MSPQEAFAQLVMDALPKGAEASSAPIGEETLIQFEGRDIFLGLDALRGEVTISTVVFMTDEVLYRRFPDLLAEYNAYHLLSGGFRIAIEPSSQCGYVCWTRSLETLRKTRLVPCLDELLDRCLSCTSWYAQECHGRLDRLIDQTVASQTLEAVGFDA